MFNKWFRWVGEIEDSKIKLFAKIGILLHGLMNVYENIMVGLFKGVDKI